MMKDSYTNALINETSPYLLQHAHNPVDWMPWNDNTLEKAKKEQKLLLISIGYAACHWCHVMEHESFEDEDVAQLMNMHFVTIKVDREERPDVDHVYMNAVQLMTGRGGWPLNVIALPDGKPVWGGTYFPKKQWMGILHQLASLYEQSPEKLVDYADKLEQGITTMNNVQPNSEKPAFDTSFIDAIVIKWKEDFDDKFGGTTWTPKFMMPNNYQFLLRYAHQKNDTTLMKYVNHTLTQIAYGGIFDHIGGGFARYAIDKKWHVPHFEKMLYDNGQLVSLYTDAYLLTKNDLYRDIVYHTLRFVKNEMTSKEGAFYSSLDADSLNSDDILEEGAFYVWKKDLLKNTLKEDFDLFADYYNINSYGLWENGNYILIKNKSDTIFCKKHAITKEVLKHKKATWRSVLNTIRDTRAKPGLDDKSLTSWNALMLKGYCDAYRVFKDSTFLDAALKNAHFLITKQLQENGALQHNYKDGKSTINGYLEDYATTVEAFIALYENTLDQKWLTIARQLTDYTFEHFYNPNNDLFYFTSNTDKSLVTRPMEYHDNVIPASNSVMAKNLFRLGHYFGNEKYIKTVEVMLNNIKPDIMNNPSRFSNWLDVMLNFSSPFYEIAIIGSEATKKINELQNHYIPNKIIAGSSTSSNLYLLNQRYIQNKTPIYICINNTCILPVNSSKEALKQITKNKY